MTLLRVYAPMNASMLTPGAATPALPGLLSSLRPLKRLSTNVADEAALLRRFTYKNKNQHKGCGWWRRIVEVDRAVGRVHAELGGLLGEFGIGCARLGGAVNCRLIEKLIVKLSVWGTRKIVCRSESRPSRGG